MIYMSAGDGKLRVVILETANLEEIKSGHPAKTPDGEVLIAWTPDPEWLSEKIIASGGDAQAIGKLIDEASKRPQQPTRPYHKMRKTTFPKDQPT